MKAVIYTRYSSEFQNDSSTADQARNCRTYIETQHGWKVATHYKDEAISGSTMNRPGYQEMLAAWERGEFDALVVDKLSRFARNIEGQERALKRLTFYGLRVVAVNDGYDSADKGSKTQRQFKGVMNEAHNEEHDVLALNRSAGLISNALIRKVDRCGQ